MYLESKDKLLLHAKFILKLFDFVADLNEVVVVDSWNKLVSHSFSWITAKHTSVKMILFFDETNQKQIWNKYETNIKKIWNKYETNIQI